MLAQIAILKTLRISLTRLVVIHDESGFNVLIINRMLNKLAVT
jgi:hypothetical protein